MSDAMSMVVQTLLGNRPNVRTLASTDVLPASFELGFDQLGQLDPQWVWVAERHGQIEGCIVASPCHGVALVWRVTALRGGVLLPLLRQFMRDCRTRGMMGYMTLVDSAVPSQAKLRRIVERNGGGTRGPALTLMASPLIREGV